MLNRLSKKILEKNLSKRRLKRVLFKRKRDFEEEKKVRNSGSRKRNLNVSWNTNSNIFSSFNKANAANKKRRKISRNIKI